VAAGIGRRCRSPQGANEAKCIAERKITAKVIAPTKAKGEWSSFTQGNSRSGLLRSRTIPQQLKRHLVPLIPRKYNW
jgi:hypothetical protein